MTSKAQLKKFVTDPKKRRQEMELNQTKFWAMFGTTQSGGSRYESGREVPTPVAMLMILLESGRITDGDLIQAHALAAELQG